MKNRSGTTFLGDYVILDVNLFGTGYKFKINTLDMFERPIKKFNAMDSIGGGGLTHLVPEQNCEYREA